MSRDEVPAEVRALKPCPFCGYTLRMRKGVNSYGRCVTDGCYGAKMPVVSLDDPPSVAAWNTRPAAPATDAEGERLRALIEETGSRDVEDMADMARVGHAVMEEIHRGGWSWSNCPSEILVDLANKLHDALARPAPAPQAVEEIRREAAKPMRIVPGHPEDRV